MKTVINAKIIVDTEKLSIEPKEYKSGAGLTISYENVFSLQKFVDMVNEGKFKIKEVIDNMYMTDPEITILMEDSDELER